MNFLSILKAVGKGLSIFNALAPTLAPQTAAIVKVESEVEKVSTLIVTAEAVGEQVRDALGQPNAPGASSIDVAAAKAKALLPSVEAILKASSVFNGKSIADPDRFTRGAQKVLDGLVDCLDAVEHKQ